MVWVGFLVARNGGDRISGGQKRGRSDFWWPEMGGVGFLAARNASVKIHFQRFPSHHCWEWGQWDRWWPRTVWVGFLVARNGGGRISGGQKWGGRISGGRKWRQIQEVRQSLPEST